MKLIPFPRIAPALAAAALVTMLFCSCAESQKLGRPVSSATGAPQKPTPPSTSTEKPSYSSCHVNGPYLALTFDDGPSPTLTPKLLDLLKSKGVKATFFLVGENAVQYPDIVKRIAAEGHEIGNHTWSHAWLTRKSDETIHDEISRSSAEIEKITGRKPTLIRPPYGATTAAKAALNATTTDHVTRPSLCQDMAQSYALYCLRSRASSSSDPANPRQEFAA